MIAKNATKPATKKSQSAEKQPGKKKVCTKELFGLFRKCKMVDALMDLENIEH